MINRTRLRNAGIASFVVVLVMALALLELPVASVLAQGTPLLDVTPDSQPASLPPGGTDTVTFSIQNNTAFERSISVSFQNLPSGFTIQPANTISVPANSTANVDLLVVSTSNTQPPGSYGPVVVVFTATNTAANPQSVTASATIPITITGATFTPTPSQTGTTAPATNTPTAGPICEDGFEPDNNPASARNLDVQTSQRHAICPAGDEDWVVFGGVAGKVYTIDITRMDPGIDLSLELFDSELRSIAFNDDFFNRTPADPDPTDIRPRITIRIPADGRYYVRIRDNAGRGGVNYIYEVALRDESYGPTPTQVSFVCQDLFEPDGLPEQADLITSNELQEDRKLCPTGDADWVTFFGKAGKRYVVFTDSRPYRGANTVNGETQAGADTVIVLTDRDGVSLIDVNDDIPGGSTLDSQLEFTPEVDGFYFVQIKNVGDIGNQFIRYNLTLLLCVPGQTDCGRASAPPPTSAPAGTTPAAETAQPSATPNEFDLDTPEALRPGAPAALLARPDAVAGGSGPLAAPTPLAAPARPAAAPPRDGL